MKAWTLCLSVILTTQLMTAQVKSSPAQPNSKKTLNRAMCDALSFDNEDQEIRQLATLLAKRADVNATCDDTSVGDTLLMKAAFHHDARAVEFLLEHGSRIDAEDSHGEIAFMFVAHEGSLQGAEETLKKLLSWGAGTNINRQDRRGNTALMIAAEEGHSKIVTLFLALGAMVNLQNKQGQSALMLSACDPAVVDALLKKGANPGLKDTGGLRAVDYGARGKYRSYPAMCFSDYDEEKATPDVRKLWDAASKGRVDEVKFWVTLGIDLEWQMNGQAPLMIAVENGRVDVVAVLLKAGAKVNRLEDEAYSPSILSIAQAALLRADHDDTLANVKDEPGQVRSSLSDYERIVRLLQDAGAKQ